MSSAAVRPKDAEEFLRAAPDLTPAIRAVRADIDRERTLA
jgi:hypothetical protein